MPDLPVLLPVHRVTSGDLDLAHIYTTASHPTRPSVLVMGQRTVVDAVPVLTVYWPWLTSAIVIFVLLVGFVCIWRVIARPRRAGLPYCRRCNYDLSVHAAGGASSCCPECGRSLARRRAIVGGRRLPGRLMLASVPLVLITAAIEYPAARIVRFCRAPGASWPSVTLTNAADHLGLAPAPSYRVDATVLLEVDLASGRVTHEVALDPFDYPILSTLTPAPDGRRIAITNAKQLVVFSTRSGRLLAQTEIASLLGEAGARDARSGGYFAPTPSHRFIDAETFEFAVATTFPLQTLLLNWNIRTGASRVALTADATLEGPGGRASPQVLLRFPAPRSHLVISRPSTGENVAGTVLLHDLAAPNLPPKISPHLFPQWPPRSMALSADGTQLFLCGRDADEILVVNPDTFAVTARIPRPAAGSFPFALIKSMFGPWLSGGPGFYLAAIDDNGILILNTTTHQWLGLLNDRAGIDFSADFSVDAHYVTSLQHTFSQSPSLVVWDLSQLTKAVPATPAPKPR